jgi:3-hydroxybutyryl-CoA dehydrogenase
VASRLSAHVERRLRGAAPAAAPAAVLSADDLQLGRRLRAALWREAIALVADGVCDAATVDLVACNTIGLRLAVMAPIENADYVGLDLTLSIHEAVLPSLTVATEPAPLLGQKVAAGEVFSTHDAAVSA